MFNSAYEQEQHLGDVDGDGPLDPLALARSDFNIRSLRGTQVLRWSIGQDLLCIWFGRKYGLVLRTMVRSI